MSEEFVFSEPAFIRQAVKTTGCKKEEAKLFLKREHEYFRARGIEEYEGMGEYSQMPGLGIDEQFRFTTKTTDLSADLVNELMKMEMLEQSRCGIISLPEEAVEDICTFCEADYPMCDRWYDFSEIMYKIGYMYENGIGFKKDEKTADIWYERAYREGWDRSKPFLFTAVMDEPLRKRNR